MQPFATIAASVVLAAGVALAAGPFAPAASPVTDTTDHAMQLGNFSVSLSVKDLAVSKAFYEKLGFSVVGGVQEQNWLVLQNGTTNIGLFQGMFEGNLLTFNPGWDSKKKTLDDFEDVREIQAKLEGYGIELSTKADPESSGPAYVTLADPDGNQILIDQHVPRPER